MSGIDFSSDFSIIESFYRNKEVLVQTLLSFVAVFVLASAILFFRDTVRDFKNPVIALIKNGDYPTRDNVVSFKMFLRWVMVATIVTAAATVGGLLWLWR